MSTIRELASKRKLLSRLVSGSLKQSIQEAANLHLKSRQWSISLVKKHQF